MDKLVVGFMLVGCMLVGLYSQAQAETLRQRQATVRQEYRHLYSQKVQSHNDGRKTFDDATLFQRGGINVLHLKGDLFEMAFQHGRLLNEQIHQGAVVQSAQSLKNKIREVVGNREVILNMATESYHRRYTDKIFDFSVAWSEENGGGVALSEPLGLSEATGISMKTLIRAVFFPEVLMIIANDQFQQSGQSRLSLDAGMCSDFVVWDDFSENGNFLVGRNTDFPMNGTFDRFPTVIYYEPDNYQKYMTVASAGVHNAGLVSLNESGIFIAVHTVPTTETSVDAVPVFMVANHVIRTATTFDEVVAGFRAVPLPGGWAYTVVSVNERRVGALELNHAGVSLRESSGGRHIQTNRYVTEEKIDEELFINKSIDIDSDARFLRIEQMTDSMRGEMDIYSVASIIGDHVDPTSGTVRSFPNTVSVHTTLTSAAFDLTDGYFYLGSGMAPASESTLVKLPTVQNFDVRTFDSYPSSTIQNDTFAREYPDLSRSLQHFIRAKMAYEYRLDLEEAQTELDAAVALDPKNASLQFVAGIVSLRKGDQSKAISHLTAMNNDPEISSHKVILSQYYLGRVAAARRDFDVAREKFRMVLAHPEVGDKMRAAATESLAAVSRRLPRLRLPKSALMIMFQQADVTNYQ